MTKLMQIVYPDGLTSPVRAVEAVPEVQLLADVQTLRQITGDLDALEDRLNRSPIPKAISVRGYFTPDEDDRVRQGVLLYRNCRLMAYDLILRYRHYESMATGLYRLRCFLIAFGAALVLYAKSLRIISFAEHVPMLRAKINEADLKYEMPDGFFDDVVNCYSRLRNYRAILHADRFWRAHRRDAFAYARDAAGDWEWLTDLIRHQRHTVRNRLLHVLWQRLHRDWRAFGKSIFSPVHRARHGLEALLCRRLADAEAGPQPTHCITPEVIGRLRPRLKPGDILLVRDDTRLAAAILPGFWTHAAVFIGGRAELDSLGLKSYSHVAKHWGQIPSNVEGLVIEALAPCVQLNPLEKCLRVDHLAVLRSSLPEEQILSAIAEAISQLGKPYDFEFDFNKSSRIVCTELVYRSFHNRGSIVFSLTKRLGRYTLIGDDIVALALQGLEQADNVDGAPFNPVALLLTRRGTRLQEAAPERILPLLRRIQRGWRPGSARLRKL